MYNTQIKTITSRLIIILLVSVLSTSMVGQTISAQSSTNNATSDEDRALNIKGFVLDGLGRYDEAIKIYDKALGIDPNNPITLNNKKFAVEALS